MITPLDVVLTNMILIVAFFVIHSILYYIDNSNYNGVKDYIDIFYFTTTTQSTTGYGDITPNSRTTKLVVALQHILIIVVAAEFIYSLWERN